MSKLTRTGAKGGQVGFRLSYNKLGNNNDYMCCVLVDVSFESKYKPCMMYWDSYILLFTVCAVLPLVVGPICPALYRSWVQIAKM